ncbi:MAG: hypothetical protein ACT4UQ_11490 [Gammaproteobacteria bacterium]
MKRLIAIALLALPMGAFADHLDVIDFKLKEGCDFAKFMQIANDFNTQWGASHGYRAEVAVPLQSNDLESMRWLGRSKDAATFGKAWDAWRAEIMDPNSVAGKLSARFGGCSINTGRRGFDVY